MHRFLFALLLLFSTFTATFAPVALAQEDDAAFAETETADGTETASVASAEEIREAFEGGHWILGTALVVMTACAIAYKVKLNETLGPWAKRLIPALSMASLAVVGGIKTGVPVWPLVIGAVISAATAVGLWELIGNALEAVFAKLKKKQAGVENGDGA